MLGLLLGLSAWQIHQPSNGSMWNSYSFQPVDSWMGYSFTDHEAEGCSLSLNALSTMFLSSQQHEFLGFITNDSSDDRAKSQGQRLEI